MSFSPVKRWHRVLLVMGGVLVLAGALLYGLEHTRRNYAQLLRQADGYYQAQQYPEAITAYKQLLERAAAPVARASALLSGRVVNPANVSLQIANCHYRLAETKLHHYQQAARDPRVTPRPSLETVQRLLTVAGKAYEEVPQTDPRAYMAAQVNGARVAAWQLILAAFEAQTPGRRSLKQQALQTIRQAVRAVDYGHNHQEQVERQEIMTAMLLLEALTAFSQERPPPGPLRPPGTILRGQLGDLLLKNTPELSPQERQGFQQFFFALPLEAKDPWPIARQGEAGGERSPMAH